MRTSVPGKVTIKDVAEKAGTSTATVSRVLNGTMFVSEELKGRIMAVTQEQGYSPNGIARSLRKQQTFTVGIIISDIANSFFSAVVRGIEDSLFESHYHPLICNTDRKADKEAMYIRLLSEKRVDGFIISAAMGEGEHLQMLREAGVPWVFLNRRPHNFDGPAVLTDNRAGGYQGTMLLIEKGHKDIGFIVGPQNINTGADRLAGCLEALHDQGVEYKAEYVVNGDFGEDSGWDGVKKLLALPQPPTAIFVHNNQMTIGAIRALRELNVCIPQDLALLAFDETEWAKIIEPPLTTIEQPSYEMGQAAANILLSAIRKGQKVIANRDVSLPPRLNIRGSV